MPHPRDTVKAHALYLALRAMSVDGELRIGATSITLTHAPADRDIVEQHLRHAGLLNLEPPMMLDHRGQVVSLEVVEVAR
jgi:hypothetical protein